MQYFTCKGRRQLPKSEEIGDDEAQILRIHLLCSYKVTKINLNIINHSPYSIQTGVPVGTDCMIHRASGTVSRMQPWEPGRMPSISASSLM